MIQYALGELTSLKHLKSQNIDNINLSNKRVHDYSLIQHDSIK